MWYFGDGASKVGPWKAARAKPHAVRVRPGRRRRPQGRLQRPHRHHAHERRAERAHRNLGLFKSIVNGEIREMVEDVTEASHKLDVRRARPCWEPAATGRRRRRRSWPRSSACPDPLPGIAARRRRPAAQLLPQQHHLPEMMRAVHRHADEHVVDRVAGERRELEREERRRGRSRPPGPPASRAGQEPVLSASHDPGATAGHPSSA